MMGPLARLRLWLEVRRHVRSMTYQTAYFPWPNPPTGATLDIIEWRTCGYGDLGRVDRRVQRDAWRCEVLRRREQDVRSRR